MDFFIVSPNQLLVHWNYTLVLLSIAVAIIGSFTALTHAQRMRACSGRLAYQWMLTGAITLGLAVWSMHFIGMLAFHLPVEINFDFSLTLLSIVPAIAAALLGFYVLRQAVISHTKLICAGVVMGAGISTMHYTGMAALKMSPAISYHPAYFMFSVMIAVIAAWGALLMMYRGKEINLPSNIRFILGSLVMGFAISGMHYTAMQGLDVPLNSVCMVGGNKLERDMLALLATLVSLLWFGTGSIAALFDQRAMDKNIKTLDQLREANAALEKAAQAKAQEMTRELRESEAKMRAVINAALDCIITLDSSGNITDFNTAAEKTLGYKRDEVLNKSFLMLTPQRFHADRISNLQQFSAMGNSDLINQHSENVALAADGREFPIEMTVIQIQQENGNFFTLFFRDITHIQQAAADIHNLAFYDPLTNLPNRRLLQDRLKQALSSSERHDQLSAILFIDLDNFKNLNDTRGHAVGDLLLVETANRLLSCVRGDDTVARLGGDEFVVLLQGLSPHMSQATTQVKVIGEKISQTLNLPYFLLGQQHFSTPSIGIYLFQNQAQALSVDEVLKRADTAMYQAKQAGRNTVRFFDPAMQAALEARSMLEQDLRLALTNNQFELHYQPQVNKDNQVVGAEALLRWTHPVQGPISPALFIPLAEESGLILAIGQWVLETACKQLKVWEQHPSTADLQLAVNISARQFRQPDFVEQVQLMLHNTGISGNKLKLEMTESLVLDNVEDSISKMLTLLNLNIRFSMDDFGTGYSSLTYLKRLPLSQLKIDQSFIRDVTLDTNDEAIIKTIIGMAQTLGIEVVAEGVETKAQLDFLVNNGCEIFQGYLFSKPISAKTFDQLVKTDFGLKTVKKSSKQKTTSALH